MDILLVEDHADSALVIQLALESLGCKVWHASTITEARAHLQQRTFDVLFTDLSLPDGSGLDLAAGLPHIHAVAMSGHPRASRWPACRTAGFAGYLEKPVALGDLLGYVQDLSTEAADGGTGRASGDLERS